MQAEGQLIWLRWKHFKTRIWKKWVGKTLGMTVGQAVLAATDVDPKNENPDSPHLSRMLWGRTLLVLEHGAPDQKISRRPNIFGAIIG